MPADPEKGSYQTALRLIETLRLLPRHPRTITASELRDRLEGRGFAVHIHTIQRNLNLLSAHYAIHGDESKPQHWCWAKDAIVTELPGMDPLTALAFRLARLHLSPLLPPTLLAQFDPYLFAADRILGDQNPTYRWADKVRLVPTGLALLPQTGDGEVIATVSEALLRECCFTGRYRNRDDAEREFRQVHPLALVLRGPALYLLATLNDYDDVQQLRVHRFQSAELLLNQPCQRPNHFDVDIYIRAGGFEYPEGAPIQLVVRFDRDAAWHLYETPLSSDQQITAEDNDWVRLTATVNDTSLLRWWLLGFGAGVEVLEPATLRTVMAETVRQMAARYRSE